MCGVQGYRSNVEPSKLLSRRRPALVLARFSSKLHKILHCYFGPKDFKAQSLSSWYRVKLSFSVYCL